MPEKIPAHPDPSGTVPNPDHCEFAEVLATELNYIEKRRGNSADKSLASATVEELQELALDRDLCGLAISGGGIRSATFGLGILQGLAKAALLTRFDYLSTVSGGGYIGSFLSKWIHTDGIRNVEEQLTGGGNGDPDYRIHARHSSDLRPVQHLRQYSNYLAPTPGVLSMDGWLLFAIYLRNLILNQLVMLLAALGIFVFIRGLAELFCWAKFWIVDPTNYFYAYVVLKLMLTGLVVLFLGRFLKACELREKPPSEPDPEHRPKLWWTRSSLSVIGLALFVSLFIRIAGHFSTGNVLWGMANPTLYSISLVVCSAIGFGLIGLYCRPRHSDISIGRTLAGAASGVLGGTLLIPILMYTTANVARSVCFSVPVILLAFALVEMLYVGLLRKPLNEHEREWWSCVNSRLMILATAWVCLTGVAIYSPWLLGLLIKNEWTATLSVIGTGWIGTILSGILAAKAPGTGEGGSGYRELLARLAPPLFLLLIFFTVSILATWAAYDAFHAISKPVRVNGDANSAKFWPTLGGSPDQFLLDLDTPTRPLFAAASRPTAADSGTSLQIINPIAAATREGTAIEPGVIPKTNADHPGFRLSDYFPGIPVSLALFAATLVLFGMAQLLSWVIGVNTFSLHNMYANRLVRCYLGATNRRRKANALTNFDPGDDMPLGRLLPTLKGDETNSGPVHLINGALSRNKPPSNIGAAPQDYAEALAVRDRKSESFVFTPFHAGSESTKYCRTGLFGGQEKGITLGNALAVSGAAVSPNMGYHSSPGITALLTVFNLRLGAWFGNPGNSKLRGVDDPSVGLGLLASELAGSTDANKDYVYVSDGGHFENMGIYELLRRRCRFIVAVDADAAPKVRENVGRIVRLARIDFGIRIEIDATPLIPDENGTCAAHLVVGRIHYGDAHRNSAVYSKAQPPHDPSFCYENGQGVLIWISLATTGDESADIKNYVSMNPDYPYRSTADQFFSEDEFESYRELGEHSVESMLQFFTLDKNASAGTLSGVDAASQKREPKRRKRDGASLDQEAAGGLDADVEDVSMQNATTEPVDPARVPTAQKTSFMYTLENPTDIRDHNTKQNKMIGLFRSTRTRDIFSSIYDQWLSQPEQYQTSYLRQNDQFLQIMQQLRTDKRLSRLADEIYGNGSKDTPPEPAEEFAEQLILGEMMTFLENVWLSLDLDHNFLHPVHRGWLGVFRNWVRSSTFRKYWKKGDDDHNPQGLHTEFTPAFVRFIETIGRIKD